jgi:putative addiction module CopG family antidote
MAFSLSAALEDLIRRKVSSGSYDSAAQVIEEALILLEERDQLLAMRRERLVRELASGILQADNRQFVDGSQVFQGLANKASVAEE